MAGRHSLRHRKHTRQRTVEIVDAYTLTAHRLTDGALAAGRLPKGRYVALCGQDVLPASLAEPGHGYCASYTIPSQRARSS